MEEIIDLGSISIAERWDDIDLLTYQKIEKFYEEDDKTDIIELMSIVTGKDKDFLMSLPFEYIEILINKMSFLTTLPEEKEATNKIIIDGEEYIINFQNKLRTGEYIAAETMLKEDKRNYAAILAILCRKKDELYDSHFENEILEDRIKLFEKQPVTKILQLIGFFLKLWAILEMPTQLSLKVKEEINLELENIQNLRKNGDLSARSTKRLTKKLQKLKESINFI